MKSIRRSLQTALLLVMLSVMGVAAIMAYHASVHEIDEVFDARLAQYTRLVSSHQGYGEHYWIPVPEKNGHWIGHKYEAKISFQIWDRDRHLLAASENALKEWLGPFEEGFHTNDMNGNPLRVFVLLEGDYWIMAAERMEIRNELVRSIALTSVLPAVLGTLLVMVAMGWLLPRGFLPLHQLAEAITRRHVDDLSTLSLDDVPQEVQPLVDNLNVLLIRMKASLEREKRFSADAAHELKTPLAALKLRIANLQAAAGEGDRRPLNLIAKSVDDIQRVLEQLLLLNRLEPQHLTRVLKPVSLLPLCRELLAQEAAMALDKQQDLQLDVAESVVGDFCVVSDEILLQLLLRNLVHNAVLYTPVGGRVVLRLRREGAQAVIEVIDNGSGIPVSERERVFERFHRGDGDAHASGVSGSGLGLAIAKEIVRLHGGTIALHDGDDGRGLCVQVMLPMPG